jgi:NSS family neurotransmitter:Na+ symporter
METSTETSSASARGQWTSRAGFVLAAAGSAIGLGNIWRFPYVTGQNGGAAFIIIYLLCVVFICLPYLFAELALGRHSQKNPVGAIQAIKERTPWALVGGLCVLTGVCILSYYAVIAGWLVGYVFKDIVSPGMGFGEFVSAPALVVPLLALFVLATILVVRGGVEKGIERWTSLLMPILLVLIAVVIVRSVTLDGAGEGLSFLLNPDFSKVDAGVVLQAMGQAFFSLSLGMGAMITYGSYLPKSENLLASGLWVAVFDTGIAIMAGFMIFPAVFAVGREPGAGPELVFAVLPEVFAAMPLGTVVGVVFFLLLSIAALTSTVSLLEVVVSYFVDERRWARSRSVWTVGALTFVLGLPAALSAGASQTLTDMSWLVGEQGFLGATDFLSIMDAIWGNIALALGALLLSIFVGWVWGTRSAADEIKTGSGFSGAAVTVWSVFVRFICPIVIFLVLLTKMGVDPLAWLGG